VANGSTLTTDTLTTPTTDFIAGIPNAELFVGAGVVVLLLFLVMGKR
jgi:hypothetical protein